MSNVDVSGDALRIMDEVPDVSEAEPQPLYQIYEGSRIAVGKAVGKMWQKRIEAAVKTYKHIHEAWGEVVRYYNNDQAKGTTQGRAGFTRGECTENIVFSNLNVMLPAVYSKDPDVTCSTDDEADQPFCDAMQELLNVLFRRKDIMNAKPYIKKAAGMGLLMNMGVLKLDYTVKADSREQAATEMRRITDEMAIAGTQDRINELYGQLEALEEQMEVLKPNGPSLSFVYGRNLIVDPFAELPDGTDGMWMAEKVFLSTAGMNARFTKKGEDGQDHVLLYKPSHKAAFNDGGQGDAGAGLTMNLVSHAMDDATVNALLGDEERAGYIAEYYTCCWYVWDKALKRLMLFLDGDWTWPIWVWDNPMDITRFFPYFLVGFALSLGGTVSVGETSYYLDQQDEINDINRQMAYIRRVVYNNFFYNSDKVNREEAEKFLKALRDPRRTEINLLGVQAGEEKISDMIQALVPPSAQFESLFKKDEVRDTINRMTNTSDAIRGVQFKTNTNVAAVNTYQESMQLSIGSKVDVVEDVVADIALALAELCAVNMPIEDVVRLIGQTLGQGWKQMTRDEFLATYNLDIVAGSMEKKNSVFKKKEAVQIAQAVGQFSQAAPGATLQIMLRVLQQAFSEVVIKPEDWEALKQEVSANLTKGVSTDQGMQQGQPSQGQQEQQGAQQGSQLEQQVHNLPPEAKAQIERMHADGASNQDILTFIQQSVQQQEQGNGRPTR